MFTVMYAAAQLYGTLLWAIDAPGYVTQTQLTPASSALAPLLDQPEYIVSYTVTPSRFNITDAELAGALSVNLFQPGANVSLTGSFEQGTPETLPAPQRPGTGPRIWLDTEGWSVTTDTYFHVAVNLLGDRRSDCVARATKGFPLPSSSIELSK
ncbi:hypothetical protein C7999DRAFT_30391 [Corynascus novoguineensis]|uniref:Uncharacterized protein n=1 Tax=Corynascus novoguineensis TaxID=1126955 RepID=A0AAN7CVI0_9PEZI|nr:hypothetical protein C7999DRAFT_30391 [Corynascus novoguineensis]